MVRGGRGRFRVILRGLGWLLSSGGLVRCLWLFIGCSWSGAGLLQGKCCNRGGGCRGTGGSDEVGVSD